MKNEVKYPDVMNTLKLRVNEKSVRMPSGLTREQRRQWGKLMSQISDANRVAEFDFGHPVGNEVL